MSCVDVAVIQWITGRGGVEGFGWGRGRIRVGYGKVGWGGVGWGGVG